MPDVHISPLAEQDTPEVAALLNRELRADPISLEVFRQKVLADPNFRARGAPVARHNGSIIGFMLGLVRGEPLEDAPPDADRGWITLMVVRHDFQRRGVGGMLMGRVLDYLHSSGATSVWVSPYAPNYFCPGIDEAAYPGAIRFLERHGFEVAYRPLSMECSLSDFRFPDWVREREASLAEDGISVKVFRPEHETQLMEHLRAEFPGDWQRLVRESVERIAQGNPVPEHLLVAAKRGSCIGFSRHEGERFGPFGVAGSERGRGLGAILLFRCLDIMRWSGLQRAWFMWTDDRTARLYSQAGFHETRRYSVMRFEANPEKVTSHVCG